MKWTASGALALAAALAVCAAAWTEPRGAWIGLFAASGRLAFWGCVWAAAARLAARALGSRMRGLAHLAWDGAAGLALLTAAFVALGLIPGGFRAGTLVVATIMLWGAGGVLAWRDPISRVAALRTAASRGFVVLLSLVVAAALAWNRVPPLFYDSLAYHFACAELGLVEGHLRPYPWSLHSWFPPGMTALYGLGLAWGGHTLANDANTLMGVLLLVLVFDTGRRLGGESLGAAAAVLLAASPLVIHALGIPAADLGHGTLVFATLAALLVLRGHAGRRVELRAGVLCGGALLTKYLAFLAPFALGGLWYWARLWRERGATAATSGVMRFALPALLMVAPWLSANTILLGNPVAPALAGPLPPRGLFPGAAAVFRQEARGGLPDLDDLRALGGRLVWCDEEASRFYPTPAWGWLPLVLLPALVGSLAADRRSRAPALLALALFVLWLGSFRWERFLVGCTAFLALALAAGARWAWGRGAPGKVLVAAAAVVGVLGAILGVTNVLRFTGGVGVALGRESSQAFLERSFPTARLFACARARLPQEARVLFLGEMRHYGLGRPRAAPTGFNTHPLVEALSGAVSPAEAARALRRQGFTHLLLDPGRTQLGASRYPSLAPLRKASPMARAFFESLAPPLCREGPIVLQELPR